MQATWQNVRATPSDQNDPNIKAGENHHGIVWNKLIMCNNQTPLVFRSGSVTQLSDDNHVSDKQLAAMVRVQAVNSAIKLMQPSTKWALSHRKRLAVSEWYRKGAK